MVYFLIICSSFLFSSNIIYFEEEATINDIDSLSIAISVDNSTPFTGFQFSLTLPEQLDFEFESIELTNRATDHIVSSSFQNNIITIIGFSISASNFNDQSGPILNINLSNCSGPTGFYLYY